MKTIIDVKCPSCSGIMETKGILEKREFKITSFGKTDDRSNYRHLYQCPDCKEILIQWSVSEVG